MRVYIKPSRPSGTVSAPPSKSYAHRLLISAALADGVCTVRGVSDSQDVQATLDCTLTLGAAPDVSGRDIKTVTIRGGPYGRSPDAVFACRESGSTLRFFLPIALATGEQATFSGTERLISRGISVYEELFREKGIRLTKTATTISAFGRLQPGEYTIRGDVSSQFVSGLLFALPLLAGDSTLRVLPPVESRPYIDITLDAMRRFGVIVEEPEPNTFRIPGNSRYLPHEETVEGDWSNAAVLYAFRLLGGQITVTGLDPESRQGDRVCLPLLEKIAEGNTTVDLSDCPDLGPVLFAAAAIAGHGATFTGTRRLRIKESDRAAVMAEELRKFGVEAEIEENRVVIPPAVLLAPSVPLESHNDHRIVMALTLLCAVTGGEILGVEAIRKSYPDFFRTVAKLGLGVTVSDAT